MTLTIGLQTHPTPTQLAVLPVFSCVKCSSLMQAIMAIPLAVPLFLQQPPPAVLPSGNFSVNRLRIMLG